MPHDHLQDHKHDHDHDHRHAHGHDHTHTHTHGPGHNGAEGAPYHLHSHMSPDDEAAELQALTAQFIEGFTQATDKAAFLRLAGVPLEIPSDSGAGALKLVDVSITHQWQVGAASPAFGSDELSYLPYPGDLIKERVNCALIYVSLKERRDVDLRTFLKTSKDGPA
ncbi:MAG: hypothetical protein AAFR28_07745 [Pseudomonadota bacterium]